MKKLIAFDLDGTLTQHRTKIEPQSYELLEKISKKYDMLMVGAGDCLRIYNQINNFPVSIIGNYGMQRAVIENGEFKLVKNEKCVIDKAFFTEKCDYLRNKYGYTEYVGDSIDFHESGMVTFALLGTKADIKDKVAFDPNREKRKVLYPEILEIFKDYNVFIGGSSSFDFTAKHYNKYYAVTEYAKEKGYSKEEILFVGDDFGDGGGDSHIRLGGIDYINVKDYKKVTEDLQFLL